MAGLQAKNRINDSVNPKNVLVTVPNTGWIHKGVVFVLLQLQLNTLGHTIKIILPTHNPLENNLHHIIKDFIEGGYDYWLSIDSDNPPLRNPLELVQLDKDIIGLPTPVWHFTGQKPGERPMYWNAYDYVPEADAYKEHQQMEGLQKVDAVGTGCFLISKRVFMNPEMRKAPFQRKLLKDGRVNKGNDISFCERAREQGFEIYAHYSYLCQHFKELELGEVFRGFRNVKW